MNGSTEWLDPADLECGFQIGWYVQDIPLSSTRSPLGPGRIVGLRSLGGRQQLLIQLDEDGRSLWLPYENLRRIKDVRMRFVRAEPGSDDHAERLRLRLLAYALENWNHVTGSLDRLEVDPLPHQIQLVHRILTSSNYNWLIADDVGLGKTIEVGLLLAAMKRKGQARRVLVIAPAGLTRQWQDELHYKFGQNYEIYGRDFGVNKHEHWKLHDHVIASIDLAKREEHLVKFKSTSWDVVVFDEGHKLTKYASGERADRYRLAEALRPRSEAFLVLSGTPHQGYTDRFIALLELVRPDLRSQIQLIEANPEVVREIILRNRKSEVTDTEGRLIFKGQKIYRVAIEPSSETRVFQQLLHEYLHRGYKAGEDGGAIGRAIGFVMTTYRKLASSSIAAIEHALRLRLEKLVTVNTATEPLSDDVDEEELALGGDDQDDLAESAGRIRAEQFFVDEKEMLKDLLRKASIVRQNDEKVRLFLDEVVEPLYARGLKLLIFTEYRATQLYIQEKLWERLGRETEIVLINGSMSLDEKVKSIEAFNRSAMFLISTEAGGEGINLHTACHVMVNYDLPWNPARLVQRIGRLYRYGQQETVIVFNLHARDTFDNLAIDLMLQRVTAISRGMAPVGAEFNERLHAEILGDILENLDLASVLQSARSLRLDRTRQKLDEALERARHAQRLQQEIFSHVAGFDPNALQGTLGFTMKHVKAFVEGMLPMAGIEIQQRLYGGKVLEIRLPDRLRGEFAEFGQRTVVRVTTDRREAQLRSEVILLDFETPFFQALVRMAKSKEFQGLYACTQTRANFEGALAAFMLRWQNDQGDVTTEEFVTLSRTSDGVVTATPPFLVEWLVEPARSMPLPKGDRDHRSKVYEQFVREANRQLSNGSSRFKHPNGLVELAAADVRSK